MPEKHNILIVEDDPVIRDLLTNLLDSHGYQPLVAAGIEEARQLAQTVLPSVALVDLNLPDGNGLDIISLLKQKDQSVSCFVMTGFASMENAVNALKSGADDFFVKPFVLEEILHRIEDVLERKLLREQLARFEERYRLITDNMRDGLIILDARCRIMYINPAIEALFGYEGTEIVRQPVTFLIPDTAAEGYLPSFQNYVHNDQRIDSANVSIQGKKKDGGMLSLELSLGCMTHERGKDFVCVLRDVSERKDAEDKLLRRHRELDTLFHLVEAAKLEWEQTMDCILDMVVLVDAQKKIKRCNRALMTFLGRSPQEILGSPWDEVFLSEGMYPEAACSLGEQVEHFHAASKRWFVYSKYRYFTRGSEEQAGEVITIHDTTRIKEISAELEKKNAELAQNHDAMKKTMDDLEKAYAELKMTQSQILQQEKMASIGQLAAGVAHEINNPTGFVISNLGSLSKYLEKIGGFLQEIENTLNQENGASAARFMELKKQYKIGYILEDIPQMITESLDGLGRVKTIVQNLKNFSRVDQAQHTMADINDCMESTINIVWNELKYKTTLTRDYGEIPRTYCYPQQLNQVFMNLLVNAAQAIPEKGVITVQTRLEEDSIVIRVADTGKGIPAENLRRIFEPFFTTKEVGKGTGLGLSIAYDIVTKKHGGSIEAESEPGKGTTFILRIPVAEGGEEKKDE